MKVVEITITAQLPDDDEEIGHEAIVATKELTHAVVVKLEELKLHHVRSQRKIVTKREPVAAADAKAIEARPVRSTRAE